MTYAQLVEEYNVWLSLNNLQPLSADELVHELMVLPQYERSHKVNSQVFWLLDFIERWESVDKSTEW